MALRAYLEPWGYRVLDAPDGATALSLVRQETQRIDLLVTDVALPGMSGWQIADHISELIGNVGTIYISAYPRSVLEKEGRIPPHAATMQKPFTESALLAEVRRRLPSSDLS